ncbi:type I-E CRISPR-associated protein Cse2/CasB [Caballeronia sp. GAWG1-5s-s]|uniref:type I-E CRISPR-associated protein Cse2/CasB n=1 Tax=Caballeronia sp. GAWG1-5s-s TaxID=2921743 RepID=UPI002027BDCD|nr:type I-E CRISPR-associated protein Cse2/CasB [Caballeronia sp. GAWG1-5s-s]
MKSTEPSAGAPEQSAGQAAVQTATPSLSYQIEAIAAFLKDAGEGVKASKNDRVALARLDPEAEELTTAQTAALTHAAERAKLDTIHWSLDRWRRWAFIAYGIALAGHDRGAENGGLGANFGRQLATAGVSEARVTRLLDARGTVFFQLLRRVLRLLASKSVKPNWVQLARLVLNEGARDDKGRRIAEKTRLDIAHAFFAAKPSESRDD